MIKAILSVIETTAEIEASGGAVPPGKWHPCTMHAVDVASYRPALLHPDDHTTADAQRLTRRDRNRQVGMYLDGRIAWGAYPCDVPAGKSLSVRYEVAAA